MQCTNENCTAVASNEGELRRHNFWFCSTSSMYCAWGCENTELKNTSLFQHCMNETHLKYADWFGEQLERYTYEHVTGMLSHNGSFFLYKFKLTNKSFDVFMVSSLTTNLICNYEILVELLDVDTGLFLTAKMISNNWQGDGSNYDYFSRVKGHFDNFMYGSEFTLRFKISPVCNACKNKENLPVCSKSNHNCGAQYDECLFRSSPRNEKKHCKWFCDGSRRYCNWTCRKVVFGESLFDHYYNYFPNAYHVTNDNFVDIAKNDVDEKYGCVVNMHGVNFIIFYRLNYTQFHVHAVSDVDAEDVNKFDVEIEVFHNGSTFCYRKKLSTVAWEYDNHNWDYMYDYNCNDSGFDLIICDDQYDVRFGIKRLCKDCS